MSQPLNTWLEQLHHVTNFTVTRLPPGWMRVFLATGTEPIIVRPPCIYLYQYPDLIGRVGDAQACMAFDYKVGRWRCYFMTQALPDTQIADALAAKELGLAIDAGYGQVHGPYNNSFLSDRSDFRELCRLYFPTVLVPHSQTPGTNDRDRVSYQVREEFSVRFKTHLIDHKSMLPSDVWEWYDKFAWGRVV